MATDVLLFYLFGAIAVGASLLVVLGRNPMHSLLLLIVSFAALAGLYIGLEAPFAAVVQIIIYAGAIMVLFLFVVMLLNAHREDEAGGGGARLLHGPLRAGAMLAVLLVAELAWALTRAARGGGNCSPPVPAPTRPPCSRCAPWATCSSPSTRWRSKSPRS